MMEKVGLKHRDRGESVYEAERIYGPQFQSATYDSILEIDNVRTEHYSTLFRCEAVNKFGAASTDIQVDMKSQFFMFANVKTFRSF